MVGQMWSRIDTATCTCTRPGVDDHRWRAVLPRMRCLRIRILGCLPHPVVGRGKAFATQLEVAAEGRDCSHRGDVVRLLFDHCRVRSRGATCTYAGGLEMKFLLS